MNKKILMLAVIVFLLCIAKVESEPYHYPVLPGDSLWKITKNYDDRVALCNIPDSVLTSMSTDDLLFSVFQFPFIQNLVLLDNFLTSFDNLRELFNGLDELYLRNDAFKILYERYFDINSNNNMVQDLLLENFLSIPSILEKFNLEYKKDLLYECLNKLNDRIDKETFLKEKSLITASFLLIRLLSHLDYSRWNSITTRDDDIKKFSETSEYPSRQTCTSIIYEIIKYKKEKGD